MWVQKGNLRKEISWSEILDWVVIDGVLWVEVLDDKEEAKVCIVRC